MCVGSRWIIGSVGMASSVAGRPMLNRWMVPKPARGKTTPEIARDGRGNLRRGNHCRHPQNTVPVVMRIVGHRVNPEAPGDQSLIKSRRALVLWPGRAPVSKNPWTRMGTAPERTAELLLVCGPSSNIGRSPQSPGAGRQFQRTHALQWFLQ